MQKALSLCSVLSNNDSDVASLSSLLVSSYVTMMQFNHLPDTFFSNVSGSSFDTVINDTLAAATPLAAVNETLWHAHGNDAKNGCLDFRQSQSTSFGIQVQPFTWAQCNWQQEVHGSLFLPSCAKPARDRECTVVLLRAAQLQ